MQKDIVNWGIISTARIANTFAQDVRHCTNSKLYAVASRNIKDAKHFAHNHQIPHAYGSYTSMLEDPNIDAVYIATPHTLHCENAIQAMQAGKHVLCENRLFVKLRRQVVNSDLLGRGPQAEKKGVRRS